MTGSFVSPAMRARVRDLATPIARGLGRLGLTPNALTVIGFLGTCAAAFAAGLQLWLLAGVLVIAFGIFDLFDGALARATGRTSRFGAFLDSTLDRTGVPDALVRVDVIEALVHTGAEARGAPADWLVDRLRGSLDRERRLDAVDERQVERVEPDHRASPFVAVLVPETGRRENQVASSSSAAGALAGTTPARQTRPSPRLP